MSELGEDLNKLFNAYLCASPPERIERHHDLLDALWTNKAGIIAELRACAPTTPEQPARERLEEVANQFVGEAFCADWHDPDGSDKGVREVERIKTFFIERLTRFACDEIRLHMAREANRSTAMTQQPFDLASFQKEAETWEDVESEQKIHHINGPFASPLPPSDAAREAISDEMIERAVDAHTELFDSGDAVGAMRAALEAALSAAPVSAWQEALEKIALLDEADGHELTREHALQAVGIATKALGKHPSQIAAEQSRNDGAARPPRSPESAS